MLAHIRGQHDVEIRLGNCHFAHCNECERSNGHGRRLPSEYKLLQHLEDVHCIEITEGSQNNNGKCYI